MTLNRLAGLPFRRLADSEMEWLKNRTHDSRETVRLLAQQIYKERFPHVGQNEMKKQFHIKELTFTVNACVWDEGGDEIPVNCQFFMNKAEPLIKMQILDGLAEPLVARIEPAKFAKLLKSMVYDFEIFCWEPEYCSDLSAEAYDPDFDFDEFPESADDLEEETETEEAEPTWNVSIKYCNDTEQNIKGRDDYLPDKVEELYLTLAEYFEPNDNIDFWLFNFLSKGDKTVGFGG